MEKYSNLRNIEKAKGHHIKGTILGRKITYRAKDRK